MRTDHSDSRFVLSLRVGSEIDYQYLFVCWVVKAHSNALVVIEIIKHMHK